MKEVMVKRMALLNSVKENREKHIKEYKEACDGYRDAALEKIDEVTQSLKRKINDLKEGQVIALMGVSFNLEVPISYEKDYDQVIKMLEMSIDADIKLTWEEFSSYVMDEWKWKQRFTATHMNYVGGKKF